MKHTWKNKDVNNQQYATTFRLLIFLIQPYTFRATNFPILRSTFWLYIQSKCAPEDGRICRPKHVGLIYKD